MNKPLIAGLLALLLALLPTYPGRAQIDLITGLIGKIKDAAILAKQLTELQKMTQNLMDVYEKTAGAIQGFKSIKDVYQRGRDAGAVISRVAGLMALDQDNHIYSAAFKSRVKNSITEALDEMGLAEEGLSIALRSAKLTMKERLDIVSSSMTHMNTALEIMNRTEAASSLTYEQYQIASDRAAYFTLIYRN